MTEQPKDAAELIVEFRTRVQRLFEASRTYCRVEGWEACDAAVHLSDSGWLVSEAAKRLALCVGDEKLSDAFYGLVAAADPVDQEYRGSASFPRIEAVRAAWPVVDGELKRLEVHLASDEELTERQRNVLRYLLKAEALDRVRHQSTAAVAVGLMGEGAKSGSLKHSVAALGELGLVKSTRGGEGGIHLTPRGAEHARKLG